MDTVDTTQPAEHVKAEIIGRRLAYEKIKSFLSQTKMIGVPKEEFKGINYR